ncbi:MAG: GlsB/YeaQ/YmgE family stress response membrane protein [Alphaproteobacteria bacterium]
MGILTWIILCLVAGLIAKFIMPGNDPGGLIVTIIVGIAGAVIGGFIASAIGFGTVTGFNIRSIVIAAIGAFALLFALRMLKHG